MAFNKIFKGAIGSVKSTVQKAISDGMPFSVQVVPLENREGEHPDAGAVYEWNEALFKKTLKYTPLNPRALEGMKKAWEKTHSEDDPFVPKKQVSEILVILIAPADDKIYVTYSVPNSMDFVIPGRPLPEELQIESDYQWPCAELQTDEANSRSLWFSTIVPDASSSVFKHKETLRGLLFQYLKDVKVYTPEVDDDEDDEDQINLNDL